MQYIDKLIKAVLIVKQIIITKAEKIESKIIFYHKNKKVRIPGGWEGKITMSDDFDDELPSEILASFIGKED
ncbi:MAG: type II toxin-antitoxin system prevent-host-death family antitoxin [Cyanobacteriota bacterium]|nr:type II toxin-antitoxin system prevent-host-death family antitoxin [Cyanobacteriota bacterium]